MSSHSTDYNGKKVTILGLGKSGLSCIDFFADKQVELRVIDTRNKPQTLPHFVTQSHFGSIPQQWLLESDLIVISPGLALATPEVQSAVQAGIEVVGDIELFCRETDKPIIAITGSNGKSTVTSLVNEMAKAAGLKVGMGGNIGIPALSLLEQDCDLYVLELSSFQLETTYSLKAKVATVLNVTEDHMDRYADLAAYRQAKLRIYTGAETAVVNSDDALSYPAPQSAVTQLSFGTEADYHLLEQDNRTLLAFKNQAILATDEMQLVGRHNYMNALAALALCDALGIDRTSACRALREFQGLAHRFQLVQRQGGVTWINDSKATNVGSTLAALQGLQVAGTLYLLLGGDGKGADFSELALAVNKPNIQLCCFGRDGAQLAQLSAQSQLFDSMQSAVAALKPHLKNGDMVLLSPACASLDQFANFEQRGNEFARLAEA
ncbi:UDP-N-acetylmuramoyl-L-alanine--D-glutamate ligase [Testudinibacter sp. TR-2022]|uniref:UDP-N-acetylmuramoyl-L-alanine--D-glutamate ligase n=1 Tax=Testudinibacter sp. TR-2022 TaxID=2585029 RepID=UPI00111A13C5|nr:UDP-N-acetylmuramoyl-L-alanine--D-glutamate ligase [Testudinibacter sp. TR-2022]TNH03311.1 UDP-N-acetylmuramoyl-L-alanine--D-glutamate ligase [Pasteurellaceae bacterium Phil31]TNH08185.1 UDP-N-acetylmuramoyl-L-alanine--D-glutamate ligase [Testudinibacter sp. TR-2022]TNH11390.1 UDP-N-acetylmuramoyl-L-alanine--D-glutamate ligase [Testudinibacter sp. TR-2022]TNH13146.1 UDP-N-acetylmuramoyl-L-alanine--D-glutamate ligase [Testudinibacter sp. TR-2022]TNH17157.1 UDP-N-acetylmuramoyl-L-alanine--D-g